MPAARQRSSSPFMALAVTATTGVRAPFVPRSSTRASGASARSRPCAACGCRRAPPHSVRAPRLRAPRRRRSAVSASTPSSSSWRTSTSRLTGWSSTTSTRAPLPAASAATQPRRRAAAHQRRLSGEFGRCGFERQRHGERRADARRALDRDVAAPSAARAGARSKARARCRRSAAWSSESACANGWNSRACCSSSMPMPVSLHRERRRACARPPSGAVLARTMMPPRSVNLSALPSRLNRICRTPRRIADQRVVRARLDLAVERQPLGGRLRAGRCSITPSIRPDSENGGLLELQPSGLDLREVEHVVDDAQQRLRRIAHGRDAAALVARRAPGARALPSCRARRSSACGSRGSWWRGTSIWPGSRPRPRRVRARPRQAPFRRHLVRRPARSRAASVRDVAKHAEQAAVARAACR